MSDRRAIDVGPGRITTRDSFPPLGCTDVQTPKGKVHVHDGPGVMSMRVDHGDGESSIGVLVYDPENGYSPERVTGLLGQLSPGSARVFAESLLRLAGEIDGGRMDS